MSAAVTQAGYTFNGWSPTGLVKDKIGTSTYVPTADDITLTALWTPITYSVAFDPAGATGSAPSNLSFTTGDTQALSLPGVNEVTLVKTGYHFGGWTTDVSDPTPLVGYVPTPDQAIGSTITLHAIWIGNQYTVSFVNSAGEGSFDPQTYTTGEDPLSLPDGSTLIGATGYHFAGWTTVDGDAATLVDSLNDPSAEVYAPTASITLYALWAGNQYTVSFDANNGDGSVSDASYTVGGVFTLDNGATLSRAGYTFGGWSTVADDASTLVASNFVPEADVTLYAFWDSSSYTITYDANFGSGAPSSTTYVSGRPFTLDDGGSLNRDGYTFGGWSLAPDSTEAVDPDAFAVTEDTRLYAIWVGSVYSVTFDGNGTVATVAAPVNYTVGSDSGLTLEDAIVPAGYHFVGWSSSATDSTALVDAENFVPVADNTVLYAVVAGDSVTVSYDANGGDGAPADGSAFEGPGPLRVVRGGSYRTKHGASRLARGELNESRGRHQKRSGKTSTAMR